MDQIIQWFCRIDIAALPLFLKEGELDFLTQPNPEGTGIFQNQWGGGEKKTGGGKFLKLSSGKTAGDETSNRKQNFRMNLQMFS